MNIQIGEKGQMREVRIKILARQTNDTVYIGGTMGYGSSEHIGIEIDAETLADIVRAAVKGGHIPEQAD